jgi:hypothetical protein
MSDEIKFLGYVVEAYKADKGLSGKEAFSYLESTGALDYVLASTGALHTTGVQYTINQIDEFVANNPCASQVVS